MMTIRLADPNNPWRPAQHPLLNDMGCLHEGAEAPMADLRETIEVLKKDWNIQKIEHETFLMFEGANEVRVGFFCAFNRSRHKLEDAGVILIVFPRSGSARKDVELFTRDDVSDAELDAFMTRFHQVYTDLALARVPSDIELD